MARALVLFMVLALWMSSGTAAAKKSGAPIPVSGQVAPSQFECGGKVEAQAWALWDQSGRRALEQDLLQARLLEKGDVYALYDFQIHAHNLVSMAQRCQRSGRLLEMARLVRTAYKALAPGSVFSPGRRWICRGGSICNNRNQLLNKEVMLDSAQFLGLACNVANALATSGKPLGPEERAFINETLDVATEHLLRWGDENAIQKLRKLTEATPQDVTDGSSALFFSDTALWMIAMYAELSGIVQSQNQDAKALPDQHIDRFRRHVGALLQLFLARVSVRHLPDGRAGIIEVADIDNGYWRLYADNRYAGYEKEEKPVICAPDERSESRRRLELLIAPDKVPGRQDIGWDFSHARRLVQALDAIERNRETMQSLFSLSEDSLPSKALPLEFANNLIAVMWNGDPVKPLFANYWSGANGWYRVAYDNGTGDCREGYPPYGLTDSFVTGGYVTWARYRPEIGLLGKNLYASMSGPDGAGSSFIAKYYPDLGTGTDQKTQTLTRLAFLPTLVGVGIR